MNITRKPVTSVQTMFMEILLWATFLTISELAPTVVLPASSTVGSPVVRLVLGSVLAGWGQAKSMPVPLFLAVAVGSGPNWGSGRVWAGAARTGGDGNRRGILGAAGSSSKTAWP